MSKAGSAAKVKLNSFDDLFGTKQPQTGTEQIDAIQADIEVIKSVVREHSEKLQKIS